VALLALGARAASQEALERALKAWERGDASAAHGALLELFAADDPARNQAVQASIDAFRNAGGTDAWIEAAARRLKDHPNDAALQFYLGSVWQDLKHLRRAEDALGQARALAPGNPAVQEAWAWNARLRFDAATAAERARGASFPDAERFRADQEARLAARGRGGAIAALGALGLALLVATVVALARFAPRLAP
jgi:tetratricopeptide (TPR) repeat protein